MLYKEACAVQKLFTVDEETRHAFRRPPRVEDLIAELENKARFDSGELELTRGRIRLGKTRWWRNGEPIAYIGISVVNRAPLTPYELKYVWHNKGPRFVDGIFVRRLVVNKPDRSSGYGAILLEELKTFARQLCKRIYLDTKADNLPMRKLAMKAGGFPNMFWHTPNHTLMVRYIWT
ncbi:MAG: hypothetical protein A3D65_02965 [Candidatus Lloydbacteria bacterium RIFCSPHIGHO2_02_FULL_50_13]|uniref:N-acetyltransferase domain-containing protein n=1 Tax=Candidatus Lloydbacteria bacterium RIFCSPHIGHO2_02_FULL_50_13 TaxID=1798661 RepID=A0A1G2D2L2_9BACT|nr:MAG: hypothetical protein A3D65_02965 [Candidatus Lloydbacteria bacterium RIFCSPHIGHO2_02_FULL_50_13]